MMGDLREEDRWNKGPINSNEKKADIFQIYTGTTYIYFEPDLYKKQPKQTIFFLIHIWQQTKIPTDWHSLIMFFILIAEREKS